MNDGESEVKQNDLATLLKVLTPRQLDFIRERLDAESDAAAARRMGIRPTLVAQWKEKGAPLDAIIHLAKLDSVEVGIERLRRLVNPALDVLEDELIDKRSRHQAAVQILDRAGLVAGSKTIVVGDPANPVTILVEYANNPLAPAPAAPGPDTGPAGGTAL